MLHLIHYESRPAKESARFAIGLFAHTNLNLPSLAECELAIESLCRRKLTNIVDADVRSKIAATNRSFNGIGPTDGMPMLGDLDFTERGAELWRAVLNFEHSSMGDDYYWFNCGAFIYRRNATILLGYNSEWVLHDSRFVRLCLRANRRGRALENSMVARNPARFPTAMPSVKRLRKLPSE